MKELAGHWAETLREGADTDPDTGESLAEPYIRERRELYGLLLLRSGRLGGAKFPGQSWSKLVKAGPRSGMFENLDICIRICYDTFVTNLITL